MSIGIRNYCIQNSLKINLKIKSNDLFVYLDPFFPLFFRSQTWADKLEKVRKVLLVRKSAKGWVQSKIQSDVAIFVNVFNQK